MKDKQTLSWLYARSKNLLPKTILLTLMRCAATILDVLFALTSRYVVDAAVGGNSQELWRSAAQLFAIILAEILIRFFGQALEVKITARLNMNIRGHLFSTMLKRDFSAQSAYHSGDLLTRLSDDTSIVSSGIISLIPSTIALVVGLFYALYSLMRLDINFAFIFLIGGIIILLAIGAFRGTMKRLHKNVQEAEGSVRSFYQESLSSLLMVKVFGIEADISKKSELLQSYSFAAQMKRRNLTLFASSSLGFIFSIGTLYALVHSAWRLYLGTITFGSLTAIIQLVSQVEEPFAGLSGIMPAYYSILASAERIIEIENLPEDSTSFPNLDAKSDYPRLNSIDFKDVSFSYGRDEIFKNASLSIQKSDFVVISGVSGIGKSTLIKLLLGVINPTSGNISLQINNQSIPVGKHSRPLFSYVPQGNLLLSGTIREAVSMVGKPVTDDELKAAAQISCATDFIDKLPNGLDTYIGEKGAGLSEGQIQRLAVMRALLSNAPILLFDEATSALDEETEAQLLKNIRNMNNKTCILISHKPAAFEICNKHIYIDDKKIWVE